jgi:signal transduction histidine kinase
VRELAGRLISAQETERRRIARELHDDFSQRLALLSVEMELLGSAAPGPAPAGTPRLGEMATRVKELSSEVHRMAYELHPAKLEQLGLVAAARGYCRELSQKSGLQVTFDAGDFPRIVPSEVALCFYRIIQESLQNALRHSGAREARVELRVEPAGWCLRIRDAGRGFAPPQAAREGGLGLSSMRERTRQLRGRLQIDSAPGRGTTIQAFVPHPSPPAPPGQAHETTAP